MRLEHSGWTHLFRCRFGVRLPIFKNAGIVVFYAPQGVVDNLSQAIFALKTYAVGTKWERDVEKIVWEAEPK